MSYRFDLTAEQANTALNKAFDSDNPPVPGSDNLVNSERIHAFVTGQVNAEAAARQAADTALSARVTALESPSVAGFQIGSTLGHIFSFPGATTIREILVSVVQSNLSGADAGYLFSEIDLLTGTTNVVWSSPTENAGFGTIIRNYTSIGLPVTPDKVYILSKVHDNLTAFNYSRVTYS